MTEPVQFNMATLLGKVKDMKSKGEGNGKFPKSAFIPEGTHKGRFIIDPTGELFTEYYAYGYFGKGIRDPKSLKPSQLPEGFEDRLSTVIEKLSQYHWKYRAKKTFLVWFWLEETNAVEKDRWEPKNLYCLIGNNKFQSSFLDFIQSLGTDAPDELQRSLNPFEAGVLLQMMVTSGQQGQVQFSTAFPNKELPPLNLKDQVYTTLEEAYIRPGFNQEKYDALLKEYEGELDTYISTGAKTLAEKEAEKEAGKVGGGVAESKPEIPDQGNQPPVSQSTPVTEDREEVTQSPPAESNQESSNSASGENVAPWMKFRK